MDTDASLSSKGKDTNVAGDGSLTSDIQELRNKVVELRNQELKRILATRDSVLKHLFYMNYMLSKSDSVDTYTKIIDDVSEKVDQAELRDFLQSHKLDPEKKMDSEKSAEPSGSIIAGPNAAIPNAPEQSQSTQPINNNQTPVDQTTQPKKQKRVSLPPVERMVTRAASGAINPKSVDEILKDAERLGGFASSSVFSTPPTPVKLNLQPKKHPQQRSASAMPRNGEGRQAANTTTGRGFENTQTRTIDRESLISNYHTQPIYKLFQNPKKALTTEDWTVAREEVKMVRVLERIDQLKSQELWSFQQIEPFRDPPRPYAHRDYLLDEMVWMQKDFKKERKWKIAAAFHMSRWVMEWHESKDDKEKRDALCVKARIPLKGLSKQQRADERENTRETSSDANDDVKLEPVDEARDLSDLPPNQVKWSSSSDEMMIDVESVDDEASTRISIDQTKDNDAIIMPPPIAPNVLQSLRQKVTSLSADAFLCCLEGPDGQVYDVDSIFPDLPAYEPPRPSDKDMYVDYIHYSRIMPISKRMYRRPRSGKNVRKRSMSEDSEGVKKIKIENDEADASGEQDNTVSLFSSQNMPIHVKAPRPDLDTPCIWYPEDDELLMKLTKQFQYNWELIADSWNSTRGGIIGFPRTPWACYQRWAQKDNLSRFIIHESETSNEGSNEMLVSDGAIDAPSSSSVASGPSTLSSIRPKRDIIPKKVSKPDVPKARRNSSLFDVIKKSAKKRQETILKQTQTRRNNDQPGQVVHQVPGPIELSKLKSENERRYQAALLEQRQVAALAFQSHVRAPTGIPYLAQGRPPIATSNQLQYVMQQQQRQVNAIAVQQRHPTQQITSAMTQNQFYNVRMQQARAHILQSAQTSSHQNQQQISQQHQQVGQQSPQPPQSQQPTLQPQTSQASQQQSQQTTQQQ